METALIARDLDTLVRFYTEALGFRHESSYASTDAAFERAGLGSPLRIAFLADRDGTRLKIVQSTDDREPRSAKTILAEPGRAFITIFRDDVDASVARARRARGAPLRPDAVIGLPNGRRISFVLDPERNPVEIIQPPPR